MDNKIIYIATGGFIGGGLGYIVGLAIADIVSPDYYTEEELGNMAELSERLGYAVTADGATRFVPSEKPDLKERQIDYSGYSRKPDLVPATVPTEESSESDEGFEKYPGETLVLDALANLKTMDEYAYRGLRDETMPHIITKDEYLAIADDPDADVDELLYFTDDVLTDSDRIPLTVDEDRLIGPYATANFGAFSGDDHVVYVRNPDFDCTYRVLKMTGSFEAVISSERKLQKAAPVREVYDDDDELVDSSI